MSHEPRFLKERAHQPARGARSCSIAKPLDPQQDDPPVEAAAIEQPVNMLGCLDYNVGAALLNQRICRVAGNDSPMPGIGAL